MVNLKLKVEFGGGLELLFSNQRSHLIDIPSTVPGSDGEGQPADIDFLIRWLKDNLLKERPELFIEDTMFVVCNVTRACDLYIDSDGIGVQTTWNSGVGE